MCSESCTHGSERGSWKSIDNELGTPMESDTDKAVRCRSTPAQVHHQQLAGYLLYSKRQYVVIWRLRLNKTPDKANGEPLVS